MKNLLGTTENLKLYDKNGTLIYNFFENSSGYSYKRTYDSNGNILTYENSKGYSWKKTYDSNGNELTYKNSNGVKRGFDIPELTMEQVVEKIGNFKLIKNQ